MQYNYIINLKKIRDKSSVSLVVKVLIFLFVTFYIFNSVKGKAGFDKDFISSLKYTFNYYPYWIVVPIMLFPVNWGLEALKWKYLTTKIEEIDFLTSFKGVFTGVALGFATPLGLGDYVGRILQLKSSHRAKGFGAIFISRISQFYITLVCGTTSLIFLALNFNDSNTAFNDSFDWFVFFILFTNVIFISLFLFHKRILLWLKQWSILKRIYPYIEIIGTYDYNELTYILFLSLSRYLIFTTQFAVILYCFGISNDLGLLVLGVSFIFLVKSVIPTLFDLGVRESAAIYFFSHFTGNLDSVVFASLSIWFVNILVPAVLGLFLIFTLKIFSKS